jgi:hypothetical protein
MHTPLDMTIYRPGQCLAHSVLLNLIILYLHLKWKACRPSSGTKLGAVTRLLHSKQLISVTIIADTTEEHVMSVVTSCNTRMDAGSADCYAVHETAM